MYLSKAIATFIFGLIFVVDVESNMAPSEKMTSGVSLFCAVKDTDEAQSVSNFTDVVSELNKLQLNLTNSIKALEASNKILNETLKMRERCPVDVAKKQKSYKTHKYEVVRNSRNMPIGYYRLETANKKTWFEARKKCAEEDAYLVVINSKEEAQALNKFLHAKKTQIVWIGTHDMYKEGLWYTISGESLPAAGFTTWGDGEPNNGGSKLLFWLPAENCGTIYRVEEKTGLPRMNDRDCDSDWSFVCEHYYRPDKETL